MKEVIFDDLSEAEINDLIIYTYSTGEPTVIRGGGRNLEEISSWVKRLSKTWKHDRRHFNYNNKIQGSDWWEITNIKNKNTAYAYSTTPQPFHTDNAWFPDGAEINMFVMKKQALRGGEQLVYPLRKLIKALEQDAPDLLDRLVSEMVVIAKGDCNIKHTTTIITNLNEPKIFWNFYRTERKNDNVSRLLDHFHTYLEDSRDAKNVIKIRLESGDCLIMNDQKSIHARNSFLADKDGDRVLLQSMWKKI